MEIGKLMKLYSRFIRSNEMAHSFEGSLESIAVLVSFGALLLALFNRNHF